MGLRLHILVACRLLASLAPIRKCLAPVQGNVVRIVARGIESVTHGWVLRYLWPSRGVLSVTHVHRRIVAIAVPTGVRRPVGLPSVLVSEPRVAAVRRHVRRGKGSAQQECNPARSAHGGQLQAPLGSRGARKKGGGICLIWVRGARRRGVNAEGCRTRGCPAPWRRRGLRPGSWAPSHMNDQSSRGTGGITVCRYAGSVSE